MLSGVAGAAPPVHEVVKGLVDAEWKRYSDEGHVPRKPLPEGTFWSARVTPPFPAAWPPDGSGKVIYYGFAGGFRTTLSDAEEVAAPWVRVLVDGTPALERIGKDLRPIGINGVHPIWGEELAIAKTWEQADEQVRALARGKATPGAPLVKRFYCQWARFGGIGAEMKVLHSAFFAWLACRTSSP